MISKFFCAMIFITSLGLSVVSHADSLSFENPVLNGIEQIPGVGRNIIVIRVIDGKISFEEESADPVIVRIVKSEKSRENDFLRTVTFDNGAKLVLSSYDDEYILIREGRKTILKPTFSVGVLR